MAMRTSQDSPLRIAEIPLGPGQGRLGLTLCPGKKDGYKWNRDLDEDLRTIRAWGATTGPASCAPRPARVESHRRTATALASTGLP